MPDRAEHDIVDRLLQEVARGAGDDRLREMARGILDGHVTIEGSLATPAYADALQPKMSDFVDWYGSLSDEERSAQAETCGTVVEDLRDAIVDTATGVAPHDTGAPT